MDISRTSKYQELLKLSKNYLGDNQQDSRFAEASLLEKTISGEEFIGLLSELEALNQGNLELTKNKLQDSQKEYIELFKNHQELVSTHSRYERYVNKYKPLIDALVSIIRQTSKQEFKELTDP